MTMPSFDKLFYMIYILAATLIIGWIMTSFFTSVATFKETRNGLLRKNAKQQYELQMLYLSNVCSKEGLNPVIRPIFRNGKFVKLDITCQDRCITVSSNN